VASIAPTLPTISYGQPFDYRSNDEPGFFSPPPQVKEEEIEIDIFNLPPPEFIQGSLQSADQFPQPSFAEHVQQDFDSQEWGFSMVSGMMTKEQEEEIIQIMMYLREASPAPDTFPTGAATSNGFPTISSTGAPSSNAYFPSPTNP
jgi:hypothetical protein